MKTLLFLPESSGMTLKNNIRHGLYDYYMCTYSARGLLFLKKGGFG